MRRLNRLPAGLFCAALSVTTASAIAESIDRHQEFIFPGQTSQQDVRQFLGQPQEISQAGEIDIWVYNDKIEIPTLVSLIPVVGEITGVFELVQAMRKNRELIIQFNRDGIVRKTKLREMD